MRRKHDAYFTSAGAVQVLLDRAQVLCTVCEPCVGDGAIAKQLAKNQIAREVVTCDIDTQRAADVHGDAGDVFAWRQIEARAKSGVIHWSVSNPPFSHAFEILRLAHAHSLLGVAFLLRLSFLEPTEARGEWLKQYPPDRLFVLPRYSFTGDGKTDSVTCAWMIWHTGYGSDRPFDRIQVVTKDELRAAELRAKE